MFWLQHGYTQVPTQAPEVCEVEGVALVRVLVCRPTRLRVRRGVVWLRGPNRQIWGTVSGWQL